MSHGFDTFPGDDEHSTDLDSAQPAHPPVWPDPPYSDDNGVGIPVGTPPTNQWPDSDVDVQPLSSPPPVPDPLHPFLWDGEPFEEPTTPPRKRPRWQDLIVFLTEEDAVCESILASTNHPSEEIKQQADGVISRLFSSWQKKKRTGAFCVRAWRWDDSSGRSQTLVLCTVENPGRQAVATRDSQCSAAESGGL